MMSSPLKPQEMNFPQEGAFLYQRKGKGIFSKENRDPWALMVGQILLKPRQCLLMSNSQAYKMGTDQNCLDGNLLLPEKGLYSS